MRYLSFTLALVCSVLAVFAQNEELTPLGFNPGQHTATQKYRTNNHKYLTDKGKYIIRVDTLSLPFSDDFTRNTLRGYKYLQNNATDTFYNVAATCFGAEDLTTVYRHINTGQAWNYAYDTLNDKLDSTPKPQIQFTFFGPSPAGCFAQAPQTINRNPEYYTYLFDPVTGLKLDSVEVYDDSIEVAPILYFVDDEPGTLWFDNYAYVNNTYPILPPTIGVATLDGLNEYGLPYNKLTQFTYGDADKLTSKPFNLAGLNEGDSVYLSFFFEGKGLGDSPDALDSLVLEFKDNAGFWRREWFQVGYTSGAAPYTFQQALVKVPTLAPPYNYFHNVFQFRFRNKASLYGNLDHWHIDYVRFDKNRSAVDSFIQDVAFVYPFPTVLKNYTLLPADQFDPATELVDTIRLLVHNMDPNAITNPPATNFTKGATELYPTPSIVSNNILQTFNAGPYNSIEVNPLNEYTFTNSWPVDSLVLQSRVFIEPSDVRPGNDTLIKRQIFSNIMAYDDGSAEVAYGLTGTQTKKFAYEFELNQPDTLVGFQVMYAQVSENVQDLVFNFNIWDTLSTVLGYEDSAIITLDNKKPYYVDSVNGFTTYKLDTPVIFTNKIYMGWVQTDTRSLQIGYDLNSPLGRDHMYAFKNGQWAKTNITTAGSPMIRLIFDTDFWGGTTAIKNVAQPLQLKLYPNPTNGLVYVRTDDNEPLQIDVMNMVGEKVASFNAVTSNFDMGGMATGVYLVIAKDTHGNMYRNRLIKSGN